MIRDSKNYINASQDYSPEFELFTKKALRTAVGIFANGTMILVQIDGEQKEGAWGQDIYETTELLESLGVESAINLDGGGSSVSIKNGEIISKPACNHTEFICEREVASIACVRK